jgi:hypothetical protein
LLTRIAALAFVAIVIALHVVRPDVSPAQRGISRYAGGRTLVATTAAFLALALALGLTAWQLHSWLFATACLAMVAIAATPKPLDASGGMSGAIHTGAGFVFFISAAAGARSWSPHEPRSSVSYFLWIVTGLFIASILRVRVLRDGAGYYQRLTFALLVIWLMLPA